MKVLLDHNVPHDLRTLFPTEYEVYMAQYLGWSNYEDKELLEAAEDNSFSAFVTLDRSIPLQQEQTSSSIGILVLAVHPATLPNLKRRMNEVVERLPEIAVKGEIVVVE